MNELTEIRKDIKEKEKKINNLKRKHWELTGSLTFLKRTLDAVNIGIYLNDMDHGPGLWLNRKTDTLHGYTQLFINERTPQWFVSQFHPDDREIYTDLIGQFHSGYASSIYRFLHKNSYYQWCFASGMVISKNSQNKPQQFLGIVFDLTDLVKDQKQVGELLNQMTRILNLSTVNLFTKQEKNILRALANNKNKVQIAEILNISQHTVKSHIKNIRKKLNLSKKAELVKHAVSLGFKEA